MIGGLTEMDWQVIVKILTQFPEIEEAILFGSRAKGNYEYGSDVDIALKGEGLDNAVTRISGYLNDESPLPYDFDVLNYDAIANKDLRAHIDCVGIQIWVKPIKH